MSPAGGQGCGQRRLVDQAVAGERAAHGLDGGRQVIGHRIAGTDSNEKRPVLHVLKSGLLREAIQTLPEPQVGACAGEGLFEQLREPVPRGVGRIALERADVDLLERGDTTRARQSHRFGEKVLRHIGGAGDVAPQMLV